MTGVGTGFDIGKGARVKVVGRNLKIRADVAVRNAGTFVGEGLDIE